jgi:hypothetical protein
MNRSRVGPWVGLYVLDKKNIYLARTGIRTQGHPVRAQSLYQLPDAHTSCIKFENITSVPKPHNTKLYVGDGGRIMQC